MAAGVEVQLIPLTPAIDQVPVPVGKRPVVGPETTALKVKVFPSAMVLALVVTVTVGINLVIEIDTEELGAVDV